MAEGDADQALTETLTRFGLDSLVSQPSLCRNTLRDKLPDRPRETALLVTALEAGVPTRLRTESRISDVETVSAQLAEQLEQSYGLSPESARWAVQTWASALDLSSPAARPAAGQPPEGATVLREPPGAASAEPAPSGEFTAVPPPPGEATVVPTPSSGVSGPASFAGEGTVLRPGATEGAAGAASAGPPSAPAGPAPTQPKPGGGRRRRWLLIVGVLVLVGAIVGIVVAVSGGGDNSPNQAGDSHGASNSNSAPSTGGSGATSSARTTGKPPAPTFAAISPELAHRGDHDGYPQETIPAFLQAAHRGFTVETDVRWSKDGVALITHDDATGRGMVCSGGPLTVADTTWDVLHTRCQTPPSAARTNKSYGIPTFDDTVHQMSKVSGSTLFAEIKIDQTAAQNDQFLAILQKWNMVSRTVVTSFVSSYLENFAKAATRAGVAVRTLLFASENQPTTVAALQHAKVWGAVFQDDWKKIPALMAGAKQAGIHVGISSIAPPAAGDGPTQWAQAKSLGAEFVLTDHPSAYHAWLAPH